MAEVALVPFKQFDITSPKQSRKSREGWDAFFPYYAGYPATFATKLLQSAQLDGKSVVLDPWNGSGTTTHAASGLGLKAIGCDINPVMLVVSRARCLSPFDGDSIKPLANHVVADSKAVTCDVEVDDPLLGWFDVSAAAEIRNIEASIRAHLLGTWTLRADGTHFECMSSIAATFYVALFLTCRSLVSDYQTSNPTWLRRRRGGEEQISLRRGRVGSAFKRQLAAMADQMSAQRELPLTTGFGKAKSVSLRLADSAKLTLPEKSIDLVLTSPPYCTRIDYTAATRVELAVLAPLLETTAAELSRSMLGSIRVPLEGITADRRWGKECNAFLKALSSHGSKASSGYYLKTHLDYFSKLSRSLERIRHTMKPGAPAFMVVQGSYYKEIENNLPKILTEMATSTGFRHLGTKEFRISHSMAGINPYTRLYGRKSDVTECIVGLVRE